MTLRRTGGLVAVVITLVMVLTLMAPGVGRAGDDPADGLRERFSLVLSVLELVTQYGLTGVPDEQLIEGALRGIMDALDDPYSQFLDLEQFSALMEHLDQKFSGVGVMVTSRDGYITIISPIRGTPAERAGLKPYDRVIKIDGADYVGASTQSAVNAMRGEEGTRVVLTVSRPGTGETFDVEIIREVIEVPTVHSEVLAPGIGYISISMFSEHTAEEFDRAFAELQEAGIESLVLDLRNNAGGIVEQGTIVASHFVPEGPVAYLINRQGERRPYYSETPAWDRPLIVLVNAGTASTAEIVAASLHDWQVATLLGARTFGKSTVQSIVTIPGYGGIRLTTAEYVTPIGRTLRDEGLEPNVVVQGRDEASFLQLTRTLERGARGDDVADLQRHLKGIGHDAGPIDGIYGRMTEAAVRSLQQTHGLTGTGVVSAVEVALINELLPLRVRDPQLHAALTRLEQDSVSQVAD